MDDQTDKPLNHGARLTLEAYEKKIVELYSTLPPMPTKEQDRATRRTELDLTIDHRLGQAFPMERRDALWAVQERVERRRLRLFFWHMLRRLFPWGLARGAQGLAGFVVQEYARVLSPAELEAYFGKEEARNPALPVDMNQVRKK